MARDRYLRGKTRLEQLYTLEDEAYALFWMPNQVEIVRSEDAIVAGGQLETRTYGDFEEILDKMGVMSVFYDYVFQMDKAHSCSHKDTPHLVSFYYKRRAFYRALFAVSAASM